MVHRRKFLKTAVSTPIVLSAISAEAHGALPGNETLSFENGSNGDTQPPEPWQIINDPGTVEISNDRASNGSKSLFVGSNREDLEETRVGVDVTLDSVSTIVADAYVNASNLYWGYLTVHLDSDNKLVRLDNKEAGQWYRGMEGDVSDVSGNHTLILRAVGNGNEAYFDNIRFLDSSGDRIGVGQVTSGRTETETPTDTTDLRLIAYGETKTGEIDESDPTGYYGNYEPVTFTGSTGDVVTITMTSDGDPRLILLDPSGEELVSNDDHGSLSDYNSRIQEYELQSSGEYTIVATSYDDDATFTYDLSLEKVSSGEEDGNIRSVSGIVRDIEGNAVLHGKITAYHVPQPRAENIEEIGTTSIDNGEFAFDFGSSISELKSEYNESIVVIARQVYGSGMVPSNFWFTTASYSPDEFFNNEMAHTLYLTEERLLQRTSSSTNSSTNPDGGIVTIWRSVDRSENAVQELNVEITAPYPHLMEASIGVEVPENGVAIDYSENSGVQMEWAGDSETAFDDRYTGPPELVFEQWMPNTTTVPVYAPMEAADLESPSTDGNLYPELNQDRLSEEKQNMFTGIVGYIPRVGTAMGAADLLQNFIESNISNTTVSIGTGAGDVNLNTCDIVKGQFEQQTTTSLVFKVPMTIEQDAVNIDVRGLWKTSSVTTDLSVPFRNLAANPSVGTE